MIFLAIYVICIKMNKNKGGLYFSNLYSIIRQFPRHFFCISIILTFRKGFMTTDQYNRMKIEKIEAKLHLQSL